MQNGHLLEVLNYISNWILRMIYLNVLWILFTLIGFVIGGFFPSTTAMFTIIRKWNQGEKVFPLFKTYWIIYKLEFVKSNFLGYPLLIVGLALYLDLFLLKNVDYFFLQLLYIPVLFVFLLFVLTFAYVFPISVHYDLKRFHIVKNALLFIIINPFATIKMCLGLVVIGYLLLTFPGFIPILCGSLTSWFITKIANRAFLNYEEKRTKFAKHL